MMFFYGTGPAGADDLGAHVEIHLGEGADEEALAFDEPRCVFIPRGLRHGPLFISKVRHPVVIVTILTTPSRDSAGIVTDFDYIQKH
jgi:hypothetical protein